MNGSVKEVLAHVRCRDYVKIVRNNFHSVVSAVAQESPVPVFSSCVAVGHNWVFSLIWVCEDFIRDNVVWVGVIVTHRKM